MEFSKICSVLSGYFGLEQIELAEDIASETFLAALETWPYSGIPENPTAWLYAVAKNKTRNYLKRHAVFSVKIKPALQAIDTKLSEPDLSEENISDSQLKMLFAICDPTIPPESQIGLALRILCGLGIEEIATAFLESGDTINKRLYRAKQKLRSISFDAVDTLPAGKHAERLSNVLTTLYLLFNEGYYSETKVELIRDDLCNDAMHLIQILISNPGTSKPEVHALYALMCFHASRLKARKGEQGEIILYDDQDVALWNQDLISKGAYHLHLAAVGDTLSHYHLEAAIAYWHTVKTDKKEKWDNILKLYDQLLHIRYSPIAALNRIYALSKVKGSEYAIYKAEELELSHQPYYFLLLSKLYTELDNEKAFHYLEKALGVARNQAEKQQIREEIDKWK